ncbi:MAG: HEPN domain-containing protein [Burkholderiales bacterium]|nr:HEPN domain-containing protein [Burkholderiales bacterium]
MSTPPGVVNLCLVIELFLKSVIVANGAAPPKTHKLRNWANLFLLIPGRAARIVQCRGPGSRIRNETLEQINEYFVKVRYGYDFNIFAFHSTRFTAWQIFSTAWTSLFPFW